MGVNCYVPQTLEEALKIRSEKDCIILAGGSDLMVGAFRATGVTPYFASDVMIIRSLKELQGISRTNKGQIEINIVMEIRPLVCSDTDFPCRVGNIAPYRIKGDIFICGIGSA